MEYIKKNWREFWLKLSARSLWSFPIRMEKKKVPLDPRREEIHKKPNQGYNLGCKTFGIFPHYVELHNYWLNNFYFSNIIQVQI